MLKSFAARKVLNRNVIGIAGVLSHSMLYHHVPGHVFSQTLMLHVYVSVGSYFADEAIQAT